MKKTSTVQLVRNATLKIRYAGHTMLIDPVLADKGTLISALGVNKTPRVHLTIPIQDIIGGVDMVLLTHNMIKKTLRRTMARTNINSITSTGNSR